jgi:hypothetical protein
MNGSDYLDRGERLIWAGNPNPLRYAVSKALGLALTGAFFLAFALFWISLARQAPGNFWLFGTIFVVLGAGMVLSPAFYYWRARSVAYVLTDKRAVIDIQGPFGSRVSVPLDQAPFVTLSGLGSGIGNVMFIENIRRGRRGRTYTTQDGFVAIVEPEKVERQLRDAISALREESASPAR